MKSSQYWASTIVASALVMLSGNIVHADKQELSQISEMSPFYNCFADDPDGQPGQVFLNSEVEPWVAVNPRDEDHIIASWQQDRWSTGGARGLVTGVSFDGGENWLEVPIPGLTPCTGGDGTFLRASDPWLTFTPDGEVYHISLAVDRSLIDFLLGIGGVTAGRSAMLVQKSRNGGLSWSDPIAVVDENFPGLHDKQTITADPHDSDFVYAVWDRLDLINGGGPALFSRTPCPGIATPAAPTLGPILKYSLSPQSIP